MDIGLHCPCSVWGSKMKVLVAVEGRKDAGSECRRLVGTVDPLQVRLPMQARLWMMYGRERRQKRLVGETEVRRHLCRAAGGVRKCSENFHLKN